VNESIDATLDRLKGPTTADDRFRVLQELVEYWHGPVSAADGMAGPELSGHRLPAPLLRWYRWAGHRRNILDRQNHLLAPSDLETSDGLLLFYVENQSVYQWATELTGEDPPVFGRYNRGDPWEPEGITLTEHLILACLFEAVMCHAGFGASAAWIEEGELNRIAETMPPIAVGPWRWLGPTRCYARRGAFMFASPNGVSEGRQGYSVWIGAKTRDPLQFLEGHVDDRWDFVSI
jgi:hypothetical protein